MSQHDMTKHCESCGEENHLEDVGYVYVWQCQNEYCANMDVEWQIYEYEVFGRVKEVQKKVGQGAAERLAWEYQDGVLSE